MSDFVDRERMREEFNAFLPARYHVSSKLLAAKTVHSDYFWPEMSVSTGDAWVVVKRAGDWTPTEPRTAHLAAVGGATGDAIALLVRVTLTNLGQQGIQKVTFGADPDHLFPGCPCDAPHLETILKAAGFSFSGEAHDVEADLAEYEIPVGISLEEITARRAVTDEFDALQEFLQRTFPGRWKHDVLRRHAVSPSDIVLLLDADRVEGFALTQTQYSKGTPFAGGNWHLNLGENWAALGPIGISEGVRGRGWGHALVAWTLLDLKSQGVRQTIIDWTSLLDFYGRHGFVGSRTYRYVTKTISG